MLPFVISAGAAQPVMPAHFTTDGTTPMNLTGHTVTFKMRGFESTANLTLSGSVVVDNATNGDVHFAWAADGSDTAARVGRYRVEWWRDDLLCIRDYATIIDSLE